MECPTCNYEWSVEGIENRSATEHICPKCQYLESQQIVSISDMDRYHNDILDNAERYVMGQVADFMYEIALIPNEYKLSPEDLVVITKIGLLLSKWVDYSTEDWISLRVAVKSSTGEEHWQHIDIEGDLVSLYTGLSGEMDSNCDVLIPYTKRYQILTCFQDVQTFISQFRSKLASPLRTLGTHGLASTIHKKPIVAI